MKKTTNKTLKTIALGAGLVGAGLLSGNVANASEVHTTNSVDTIKAEMHKQQGNKQKLAVYRVQKGDTLSGIAEASGLTINQILEMNDIPNPNMIHIGQLINLGYSSQANNFVAQKGQSVQHNAKSYTVPTTQKAKASMNETKEVSDSNVQNQTSTGTQQKVVANQTSTGASQQATGNNGTQAQQVATTNTNQTVASQPTNNQYKPVYNQTAQQKPTNGQWGGSQSGANQSQTQTTPQQKPVVNNGGSSQGATNGSVNNGGSSVTVDVPATGGNQGSQTQKPSTPNKPSNGGQTTNTPAQKPSTGGNQGSQNQQKDYDTAEINKEYQNYISNDMGWKGKWMDSKQGYDDSFDAMEGYASTNAPKGGSSKWYANELGDATKRENGSSFNDYKYGYTNTSKTDTGVRSDYYFWN